MKDSLARERKASDRAGFIHPTDQRYGERTVIERVNGRLKDDFGARHLRVRRHKCGATLPVDMRDIEGG